MALMSENNKVCTISNIGRYSSDSIMSANMTLFNDNYCMGDRNVYATWKSMCENNEDVIRVCMHAKALVDMRDRCIDGILNRGNVVKLLNILKSNVFTIENVICIYFIILILF